MAAPPTEQRELELLTKVEMRILNVANKEEKLNDLLQTYLVPVLLKADSPHMEVQLKTVKMFNLLQTFIKPPQVILPVAALLDQYKASSDSTSILRKSLDIRAIEHSLERIDSHDRQALIPKALKGIASEQGSTTEKGMLYIVLRLLLDAKLPPRGSKDDENFRETLGLSDAADAAYLANLIGAFIRLRLPNASHSTEISWWTTNPALTKQEADLFEIKSWGEKKVLQRISEVKAKLIALLVTGAFTDEEKFIPAIYAASSFDNKLASTGEEILKRISLNMEDEARVKQLFHAHSVLPAEYRTRILNVLSQSAISTTMSEDIMAVVKLDFAPGEAGNTATKSALERTKLHKALFQYISWVARVGPSKERFTIALPLIKDMRSYVEAQGWPRPEGTTSNDYIELRSKAYETIGILARSARMDSGELLDLSNWLFQSLAEDPLNDVVINIDGALSSLASTIPLSSWSDYDSLRNMLLHYMTLPDEKPVVRSTRHAVVNWANSCLQYCDSIARWIDILAIAGRPDERNDVVEQGHKGLDPWTYFAHAEKRIELPDWNNTVIKFFGGKIQLDTHTETSLPQELIQPPSVFENFEGSRIPAFAIAVRFIKNIILLTGLYELHNFKVEPDWIQTLDARVKTDIKTRQNILAYLHTGSSNYLIDYLEACLEGATLEDSPINEESIRCLVTVASLSPSHAIKGFTWKSNRFLPLIKSNNKEIRTLGARALGIITSHPANDSDYVENICKTLGSLFANAESAVGSDINAADGALLAYSHIYSRCVYYNRPLPEYLQFPLSLLKSDSLASSLYDATLESVSQLWTAGLAIPTEGDQSLIIEKLATRAKKGNEKAIFALGRLATGLHESEEEQVQPEDGDGWSHGVVGSILKELFALHEIKRVEVQFTVGDAITAALARWDSDYVKLTLDVESLDPPQLPGIRESRLVAVLNKLFADCKATKPSLLKASGIWLFCIVQYCSHLHQVQSRLREVQASFMRLLSARDELVQETASRGLSLVYERGDTELKSALVKDLVSAFTGSGTQLKVDQETELFEPGALPTGEGNSITSYKDIVNLANEVGDQRLVYKFMSLAANAATWSTRSAFGRFGLSNILSDSEIDPKLYPKLYRYRFDPNRNVQRSMEDIWKALVKDSGTVIDTHFDEIVQDLLKSILGREWRMREASCAAISDLIHGRPFVQYEKYYEEIWKAALKVFDDVKGTVREAAFRLCETLSKGLVRQLEDGANRSAAQAMMKEALPFLLGDKGIESSVREIQIFSLITVMDVAKKGGKSLRPFIPDMVPRLLNLLSSIEPQEINFHYQRLSEENRDQIDRLRSRMVNQSPISEAIENVLRFVDKGVMAELAPKLEASIKSALGMPTKIGCSRVLTTLFTRHTEDIKPFAGRFLRLMEKQTMDKNDEVSQAYARATAYMMRGAPENFKQRFCEKFMDMYFNAEEESRRQKVADVIVALAKVSPDHFSALETELLPFSYFGAHDTDEYTAKAFNEVWSQHAGSNRTVVRYVSEIVALVERCLDTQQWALRHGGAFTVAAMVKDVASASDASGQISDANLKTIWPVLDKTLALKTFPGKEKLLEAYPEFVEKGRSLWTTDSKIAAQMKKVALREAKRNNNEYRVPAFRALWKFAQARDDLDLLDEIAEIVTPYLEELKDEDKMEVDSNEQLAEKTASNGLEAIARGYSPSKMKEDSLGVLTKILDILKPFLSSPKFATLKRQVWYECVHDVMDNSTTPSTAANDDKAVAITYLLSLDLDLVDVGTESQRVMRAKALGALLKAKARGVFGQSGPGIEQFREMVNGALAGERSLEVQKVLKDVLAELSSA